MIVSAEILATIRDLNTTMNLLTATVDEPVQDALLEVQEALQNDLVKRVTEAKKFAAVAEERAAKITELNRWKEITE